MSDRTVKRAANGQAGSAFFLFLLVMSVLLGLVTAYAIRNNPLYSDRDSYGISKFMLLERCKEKLQHPDDIEVPGPQGTVKLSDAAKQPGLLQPGEKLAVRTGNPSPQQLVASVQAVEKNKLGMMMPVQLVAQGSAGDRTITPAVVQCTFARGEGFKVMLGGGQ